MHPIKLCKRIFKSNIAFHMQEKAYNDINWSKIVYPTGQGQTGFKPDSSPWPPDYKDDSGEQPKDRFD